MGGGKGVKREGKRAARDGVGARKGEGEEGAGRGMVEKEPGRDGGRARAGEGGTPFYQGLAIRA